MLLLHLLVQFLETAQLTSDPENLYNWADAENVNDPAAGWLFFE